MDQSNDYLAFIREVLERLMLDRKLLPIKCFFLSFILSACAYTILVEIRRNENDTLIKELVLHNVRCWCAAGSN